MKFKYEEYFLTCFFLPALALPIFACILIAVTKTFLLQIVHGERFIENWITTASSLLALVFLICILIVRLAHGGFHLVYEKTAAAVTLCGHIQNVRQLGRMSFPGLGNSHGNRESAGVRMTIDGILCAAPSTGGFKAGDYVEVVYLPKSGYVLSILAGDHKLP